MIISIFASIGAQNLGDELILKNEIAILEKKYEKESITFYVFTYDVNDTFFKKDNVIYVEYFPVGLKKVSNFLRNLKNFFNFEEIVRKSDLIVIGGGGIIYDRELQITSNPLKQWSFRVNYFKKLHKKVLFFCIGINIKDERSIQRVNQIFSGDSEIFVRDDSSLEFLTNIGIEAKRAYDPVFCDAIKNENLTGNSHLIKTIIKSFLVKSIDSMDFSIENLDGIDFSGKTVGIGFRGGYLIYEYENLSKIIELILNNNGKVILVPHSFHKTDKKANDYMFLEYFSKKYNLEICKSMQESYEIYTNKKIDFALAMRLHSIILSQVYNIPFIGFSYSKKTAEILNELEKLKN